MLITILIIVAIISFVLFIIASITPTIIVGGKKVGSMGTKSSKVGYDRSVLVEPMDQKDCNSCWAVATCQVMSDHLRLGHKISMNDELNPYAFYDYMEHMDPTLGGCDKGGYIATGMEASEKYGAPLMSESKAHTFTQKVIPGDIKAPHYKTSGWRKLSTIHDVIDALQSGPVIAMINQYPSWSDFTGTGVYAPSPEETSDPIDLHMIAITSYDDGVFTLRNSYGYNWGDRGYGRVNANDPKLGVMQYIYSPII